MKIESVAPEGWTMTESVDGKTLTFLRGPEDDQRAVVFSSTENGRRLTLGAADDEGRQTISVDLEVIIAGLVYMGRKSLAEEQTREPITAAITVDTSICTFSNAAASAVELVRSFPYVRFHHGCATVNVAKDDTVETLRDRWQREADHVQAQRRRAADGDGRSRIAHDLRDAGFTSAGWQHGNGIEAITLSCDEAGVLASSHVRLRDGKIGGEWNVPIAESDQVEQRLSTYCMHLLTVVYYERVRAGKYEKISEAESEARGWQDFAPWHGEDYMYKAPDGRLWMTDPDEPANAVDVTDVLLQYESEC
jgi:hypothetical protein